MKCGHCGGKHASVDEVRTCALERGEMPKVKWGSGINEKMIDEAEVGAGFTVYEGDLPNNGVYGWNAQSMKRGTSAQGNDTLKILWINDGVRRPEFKGAPMWEDIPVMKQTMFRVKGFCLGVGISSNDFLQKMVADETGKVTKIGALKAEDVFAKINVRRAPDQSGTLRLEVANYIPKNDEDDAKPKKSKKGKAAPEPEPEPAKKSKKDKKSKAADDEPPF
jgi:hypothetical protein